MIQGQEFSRMRVPHPRDTLVRVPHPRDALVFVARVGYHRSQRLNEPQRQRRAVIPAQGNALGRNAEFDKEV